MIKKNPKYLFLCFSFFISALSFADTFDSNGVEIYYTDEGAGEPIILVHGYVSDADGNFRAVGITDGLSSEFRVISIDNRGHGKSGKPHDPDQYGLQMVQDIINLMDHLSIDKANIVGYSMGGMITNKLISVFPERVIKAVSGGFGWTDNPNSELADRLADSLEQGKGIAPLVVTLTPIGEEPPSAEALEAINQGFLADGNDPLALAAVARGFSDITKISREQMISNTVPILYLVGELDPVIAGVEYSRGVVNASQVIIIPGENHMTAFVNPVFLASIKEFIKAD